MEDRIGRYWKMIIIMNHQKVNSHVRQGEFLLNLSLIYLHLYPLKLICMPLYHVRNLTVIMRRPLHGLYHILDFIVHLDLVLRGTVMRSVNNVRNQILMIVLMDMFIDRVALRSLKTILALCVSVLVLRLLIISNKSPHVWTPIEVVLSATILQMAM